MYQTLYLTRNGLLEPLGQSQIMAYLRGLSQEYRITLITYEKDDDWSDTERVARVRTECESLGIRWLPQRFRPRPKIVAPLFSMVRMVWLVRREVQKHNVQLIHARSYIPAAVAMLVGRLAGIPFIFDMRALWPEELITAGRLGRGSLLHRAIVTAERVCISRAAAVVSLTHAALAHLNSEYPYGMAEQKVVVIPTCADLERFVPVEDGPERRIIGCLGTVLSGWFRLDWLVSFMTVAADRDPEASFELTTRDDPVQIRAAIENSSSLVKSRLEIRSCSSDLVQEVLQGQMASVMFFTEGLSKLGSSPTRMAEILGCGIPVVANDGVGDVAEIIKQYNVGVLVDNCSEEAMVKALDELDTLLSDPKLSSRCRKAAEEVFSLQAGTESYREIYRELLPHS
ncbi:glycosyltransferase [Solemya pervernicosa gill symbiont]|uniref:Glycosyltransferase n=1 Tax=Solemya pervernicosa gill symbiont TaxID=642797 RepID=A0A1T2L5M8_9GAMM|nr:glycosyltransferase [Solemya pervernicosa gill symbiont]OOZ40372.1 glycosyltransferase [Solemya pervernicosa gill symbiont]